MDIDECERPALDESLVAALETGDAKRFRERARESRVLDRIQKMGAGPESGEVDIAVSLDRIAEALENIWYVLVESMNRNEGPEGTPMAVAVVEAIGDLTEATEKVAAEVAAIPSE